MPEKFWSILSGFLLVGVIFIARSEAPVFFDPPGDLLNGEYVEGQVVFKIKPELVSVAKTYGIDHPVIKSWISRYQATSLQRTFPLHQSPAGKINSRGEPLVDLTRIYQVELGDPVQLKKAIDELYASGLVEYAEPRYIPQLLYVPNDPMIGSQYSLELIQAYDAWDISKGDTTVVIAIVDTGNDRFHPDLINAIAYNYNDTINGEDSDNDGFVDNFYGWDLALETNDPQYIYSGHGVHVAGIASASPDNGTGIAGTGYHSRYMTVKVDDEQGRLIMAYEGIIYAADRGAKVINCSWGSTSGPGQYGQDIVNYATYNRDALVVAAAGNNNNQAPFFPATYDNVLSVAATNSSDLKWSGSTYNAFVDLSAPGASILSTFVNATYINSSGTSMAAPAVAGAAAIVRHHFPDYSARQVAAQLKVTTDNIDTVPGNESFAGLLGTGRLNLYRALTESGHSYVEMIELLQDPESFGQYQGGQTVALTSLFENLLAPSENITAILSSLSEWVIVQNPQIDLGAMDTEQAVSNETDPFLLQLQLGMPLNQRAYFIIEFFNAEGQYAGRQYFSLLFNVDFINLRVNQLSTTVTSRGTLGFNYPSYSQGLGFVFRNGANMVKAAGLMAGVNTNQVVDNLIGAASWTFNQFFVPIEHAVLSEDPLVADAEVTGSFNDSGAGVSTIGLKVDYRALVWQDAPRDKFLILEYTLINQSGEDLLNFYAGFFAAWLNSDPKNHRAAFDFSKRMGYAFSAEGGHYSGISLLTEGELRHYAFDNSGANGSINLSDGFTSFEKYNALRTNRSTAGIFDSSNEISTLISSGPHSLPSEDTMRVAFAILAGDHLIDLQTSAEAAYNLYHGLDQVGVPQDELPSDFLPVRRVFPNPFRDRLSVEVIPWFTGMAEVSLLNLYGQKVWQQGVYGEKDRLEEYHFDLPALGPGSYILRLEGAGRNEYWVVLRLE